MPFKNYKSIADVLSEFPLTYQEKELIPSNSAVTFEINPFIVTSP